SVVGSLQSAVCSSQLAVRSLQSTVGSPQLAIYSWQSAVGSQQLAVHSWQLAFRSPNSSLFTFLFSLRAQNRKRNNHLLQRNAAMLECILVVGDVVIVVIRVGKELILLCKNK